MERWLDTVGGLPVHALVVHAVVVLVPVVALVALVPAFSRRRRSWSGPVAAASVIAAGLAWVAAQAGEALAGRVGEPEEHAEWGDRTVIAAAVLAGAMVLLWLLDRRHVRRGERRALRSLVAAVVVLSSLTATSFTVLAGHSGAQSVWQDVISNTQPGGERGDDDGD